MSFVIGESDYLKEWFGSGIETVLKLKGIDACHISFTIGDSGAIYKKSGYVDLMTLEELCDKINEYGGDCDAFIDSINHNYIEVQLWSDRYIKLN